MHKHFLFILSTIFFISCSLGKIINITPNTSALDIYETLKHLLPGDTLYFENGIYEVDFFENIPSGKNWKYPVTLMARPGTRPIIKPKTGSRVFHFGLYQQTSYPVHHIEINGLVLDASNVISDVIKITDGAHHIRIHNCEIKNSKNQGILIANPKSTDNEIIECKVYNNGVTDFEHGIYISSDRNIVKNCEIYKNAGGGINIYNGKGHSNYNQVLNCHIHHNARAGQRGAGIGMHSGKGHIAKNNIIHNNNTGIHTDYGAIDCTIADNYIHDHPGYDLILGNGSTDCIAINNCILKETSHPEILVGEKSRNAKVEKTTLKSRREDIINEINKFKKKKRRNR